MLPRDRSGATVEDVLRRHLGYGVMPIPMAHPVDDGTTVTISGDTVARMYTGSYTGDGATSQASTGIGFQPKYLRIWERLTSAGAGALFETTDTIVDDNAAGGAIEVVTAWGNGVRFVINAIISLDSDGFSVDDAGSDSHPNKNSTVYNYMAMG